MATLGTKGKKKHLCGDCGHTLFLAATEEVLPHQRLVFVVNVPGLRRHVQSRHQGDETDGADALIGGTGMSKRYVCGQCGHEGRSKNGATLVRCDQCGCMAGESDPALAGYVIRRSDGTWLTGRNNYDCDRLKAVSFDRRMEANETLNKQQELWPRFTFAVWRRFADGKVSQLIKPGEAYAR